MELLDSFSHHLTHLLEDEASNEAVLQTFLEQKRALRRLAPVTETHVPSAPSTRTHSATACA